MNKRTKKTQGFTIIEVVLVLAIAALIMLMVFIAWPALQRSQRDTARKNDVQTVAAAIANYRSNNTGGIPTAALIQGYVKTLSQYASTDIKSQAAVGVAFTTSAANDGTINFTPSAKCDPADATKTQAGSSRQSALQVILETNGTAQTFCQDA